MHSILNSASSFQNGMMKVVLGTVVILLVPLIAMQFSNEVNWQIADFVVMGVLCLIAGFALLAAQRLSSKKRLLSMLAIVALFVSIWAELAVGIFTNIGT